jgi:hypothetical protein
MMGDRKNGKGISSVKAFAIAPLIAGFIPAQRLVSFLPTSNQRKNIILIHL